MTRYTFEELFGAYNSLVTLLKGISDPGYNYTARNTVYRNRSKVNLTDYDVKILKDKFLEIDDKKIIAPYLINNINNTNIYIILADKTTKKLVKVGKVQSMFSNIPDKIFLYINKEAFCFNLVDEITIEKIVNAYYAIFIFIFGDLFSSMDVEKTKLSVFFMTLFIRTNSTISSKNIKEYTGNNSLYNKIIDFVDELLETNKEIVNVYGYITLENFYLAEKINEICDKCNN